MGLGEQTGRGERAGTGRGSELFSPLAVTSVNSVKMDRYPFSSTPVALHTCPTWEGPCAPPTVVRGPRAAERGGRWALGVQAGPRRLAFLALMRSVLVHQHPAGLEKFRPVG